MDMAAVDLTKATKLGPTPEAASLTATLGVVAVVPPSAEDLPTTHFPQGAISAGAHWGATKFDVDPRFAPNLNPTERQLRDASEIARLKKASRDADTTATDERIRRRLNEANLEHANATIAERDATIAGLKSEVSTLTGELRDARLALSSLQRRHDEAVKKTQKVVAGLIKTEVVAREAAEARVTELEEQLLLADARAIVAELRLANGDQDLDSPEAQARLTEPGFANFAIQTGKPARLSAAAVNPGADIPHARGLSKLKADMLSWAQSGSELAKRNYKKFSALSRPVRYGSIAVVSLAALAAAGSGWALSSSRNAVAKDDAPAPVTVMCTGVDGAYKPNVQRGRVSFGDACGKAVVEAACPVTDKPLAKDAIFLDVVRGPRDPRTGNTTFRITGINGCTALTDGPG